MPCTFKQRVACRWGRGLHSLRPAVAAPEFRTLRAHLRAELEAVDGVEDTDDDGHASTLTARVVHEDLWGEGRPRLPPRKYASWGTRIHMPPTRPQDLQGGRGGDSLQTERVGRGRAKTPTATSALHHNPRATLPVSDGSQGGRVPARATCRPPCSCMLCGPLGATMFLYVVSFTLGGLHICLFYPPSFPFFNIQHTDFVVMKFLCFLPNS